MAEELVPEDRDTREPDDATRPHRGRVAVVHLSLLPRPMLSVDDPDTIDW